MAVDPLTDLTLSGVVLSTPDPRALAGFYERLLGWARTSDEPDWVKLYAPGRPDPGLSFHLEEAYVAPVWPPEDGRMQHQLHLDVLVRDLDAAVEHAVACGATVADFQPQDDVRVLLDPDGHPFCLFTDGG